MAAIAALQSVQYVTDSEGRRTGVLLESLVDRIEDATDSTESCQRSTTRSPLWMPARWPAWRSAVWEAPSKDLTKAELQATPPVDEPTGFRT